MARNVGRPMSVESLGIAENSSEAKYVRRTEDDRWEYGTCRRINLKAEYTKRGVKDTMREAEDAIGMGQPLPRNSHNGLGLWIGPKFA